MESAKVKITHVYWSDYLLETSNVKYAICINNEIVKNTIIYMNPENFEIIHKLNNNTTNHFGAWKITIKKC